MKFINDKGFAEIIRMVIIVSFIAVIYMAGIYIWQYIETDKQITKILNNWQQSLKHQSQRPDTQEFGFINQGGCGNIYVYASDRARANSIAAVIDVDKLDISNNKRQVFDIAEDNVAVYLYMGLYTDYLHCNDVVFPQSDYQQIEALSGQVSVLLDGYSLSDKHLGSNMYKASVILDNIVFVDLEGKEIFIGHYAIKDVDVGWFPG